jgi:hypothetical protein
MVRYSFLVRLSSATPCRFIPALSLITLSALANTLGGIVRAICLAALRLMMNSNFVGCSTGKSLGLAPFNILSTYLAARRNSRYKTRYISFLCFQRLQDIPAVALSAWPGVGLQWSNSRTCVASPRICSQVSSPSGITHQLLNSMCENEENITQLLEGRNDKVDCPIASRFCFRMPSTSESSFL